MLLLLLYIVWWMANHINNSQYWIWNMNVCHFSFTLYARCPKHHRKRRNWTFSHAHRNGYNWISLRWRWLRDEIYALNFEFSFAENSNILQFWPNMFLDFTGKLQEIFETKKPKCFTFHEIKFKFSFGIIIYYWKIWCWCCYCRWWHWWL